MDFHKKAQAKKNGILALCLVWFFAAYFILSAIPAFAQSPKSEPKTGKEIAEQLRTMQPEANTEVSGVLVINEKKRIPVTCNVATNGDSWKVIYKTGPTANTPAEKFVTVHSLTEPNKYFYSRRTNSADSLPKAKQIKSNETAIPLAGSDFWLSELGFDFLHWPSQKKLKGEMRIGQPCYVLESINPDAPVVVRVKSYIEKESGGILIAEGYDRNKKLVKEFTLSGGSFKKVNGQYQLKKMTIRSPQNDSETVLEFDLPDEAKK